MSYRIDEIDQRILFHLVADARTTSAPDIAATVEVSPATIRHRIQKLEEHGIIQGYHAAVDYERTDGKITTQFTCTAPVDEVAKLVTEARAVTGVVNVRELMAGQENLIVTAVGTDTDDTARIARELSALGVTIEREDIVRDEVVSPYRPFGPEDDHMHSTITDFRSLTGAAEIVEVTVPEHAAVAGLTLEEANRDGLIPDEILVVSIERGDRHLTPKGDTVIEAGDVVSLFSRETFPDAVIQAFDTERIEG